MTALGSVVIAAYDEQSVIGRCLAHLLSGFDDGDIDVVVVPNGCSDGTADVARTFPVCVVERAEPSKPAALRAGDAAATAFPRIYLDADVLLSSDAARAVLQHLERPGALAARPPLHYETGGSTAVVRRYYRARQQLPSLTTHLWGAGAYALSREGRARFDEFPDVIGDDLFVDQLFAPDEVTIVDCAPVVVMTARTPAAMLQVLRRQNKGKLALADMAHAQPTSRVYEDLVALAARGPGSAADAAVFAVAAGLSRSRPLRRTVRWERDLSSRQA